MQGIIMNKQNGFTLIELLIVVAIIAILAAIAIPNFLEAQTRSKISRTKADMRALSVALEAYAADNNAYPYDFYGLAGTEWDTWNQLTTPVAYITKYPLDPFQHPPYCFDYGLYSNRPTQSAIYGYIRAGITYVFLSIGPDKTLDYNWSISGETGYDLNQQIIEWSYDPTNGTISRGDIIRTNKGFSS